MKVLHVFGLGIILVALGGRGIAHGTPISSFSDMPSDATTFTSINATVLQDILPSLGVTTEFATLGLEGWTPGDFTGWSGFTPTNSSSGIAPSGLSGLRTAVRFTFSESVYAIGGTIFVSPFEFGDFNAGGVSRNIGNPIVTLSAFDEFSALIETHDASNYGTVNGPSEILNAGTPDEVMASYAGVWSETPIKQVTFIGLVDTGSTGLARFSNLTSLSFSRTPVSSVPEPSLLLLLGSGLAGLAGWGRRGGDAVN